MRHRITIESNTPTRAPGGAAVENWSAFAANIPAKVEPISGREFIALKASQEETGTRFTIRYMSGVTRAMRVIWRDVIYNVTDVLNIDARDRALEIMTTEAPK